MSQKRMIYCALFHSVSTCGIFGWEEELALSRDYKITFDICGWCSILNVKQSYLIQSLITHYDSLKLTFKNSQNVTRNKNLPLTKYNKEIYKRSQTYPAILICNATKISPLVCSKCSKMFRTDFVPLFKIIFSSTSNNTQ